MPMQDGDEVILERSEEYWELTRTLSNYIAKLPLTPEQSDNLVDLLVDHHQIGCRDALFQGFKMCRELSDYLLEHPENLN